ncbi:hypothetical protein AB4521_23430 [Vibrio cyclitrophicus]
MTKIFENEIYKLNELPEDYDYDLCHRCGSNDFEEDLNSPSTVTNPFYKRTCSKCDSQWDVNFNRKWVYFFGEDETEVKFNQ